MMIIYVKSFFQHSKSSTKEHSMGEVIKCRFSLLDEGRQYTGHHRNYILESAISTCYSPEVREGIRLRESYGYLGHGRRQFAGKLRLSEVEPVKLPDGSVILTECIPSNVTTLFEIDKEGNVEHEQEILESAPGKVALGLHQSRVGDILASRRAPNVM